MYPVEVVMSCMIDSPKGPGRVMTTRQREMFQNNLDHARPQGNWAPPARCCAGMPK